MFISLGSALILLFRRREPPRHGLDTPVIGMTAPVKHHRADPFGLRDLGGLGSEPLGGGPIIFSSQFFAPRGRGRQRHGGNVIHKLYIHVFIANADAHPRPLGVPMTFFRRR